MRLTRACFVVCPAAATFPTEIGRRRRVKWWQETMVYFRFWPQRKTAGVDMVVNYVTPFDRDVISAFAHQSRRFMGGGRLAVDRYYVPGFAVAAGNLDHFGTV
jgi:hypothetical protein